MTKDEMLDKVNASFTFENYYFIQNKIEKAMLEHKSCLIVTKEGFTDQYERFPTIFDSVIKMLEKDGFTFEDDPDDQIYLKIHW